MSSDVGPSTLNIDEILSEETIRHIAEKVSEGMKYGFAEVVLVIEKSRLKWIRGPSPSEPIRT